MTGTVPDAEETEISTIGKRLGYMTLKIPYGRGWKKLLVASVSFALIKRGALISIYLRLVDTAACYCRISSVTWSNASSLPERL